MNQVDSYYECDLSKSFKERTKLNYGLKYEQLPGGLVNCDFLYNTKCCDSNSELIPLWQWFDCKFMKSF